MTCLKGHLMLYLPIGFTLEILRDVQRQITRIFSDRTRDPRINQAIDELHPYFSFFCKHLKFEGMVNIKLIVKQSNHFRTNIIYNIHNYRLLTRYAEGRTHCLFRTRPPSQVGDLQRPSEAHDKNANNDTYFSWIGNDSEGCFFSKFLTNDCLICSARCPNYHKEPNYFKYVGYADCVFGQVFLPTTSRFLTGKQCI